MAKNARGHAATGRIVARKATAGRFVAAKRVAGRRIVGKSASRSAGPVGRDLDPETQRDLQKMIAHIQRLPDMSQQLRPDDQATARTLDRLLSSQGDVFISASGGPDLKLPAAFHDAFRKIIDLASNGRPAFLIFASADDPGELEIEPAVPVELTSQQAADLLNVSRPHVVKLARIGELPHRMVGNRHRFDLDDVLEYGHRQSQLRDRSLAAIAPEDGYTAEDF